MTFENPFAKRLKDADKIQTTRRPVPGNAPMSAKLGGKVIKKVAAV